MKDPILMCEMMVSMMCEVIESLVLGSDSIRGAIVSRWRFGCLVKRGGSILGVLLGC